MRCAPTFHVVMLALWIEHIDRVIGYVVDEYVKLALTVGKRRFGPRVSLFFSHPIVILAYRDTQKVRQTSERRICSERCSSLSALTSSSGPNRMRAF